MTQALHLLAAAHELLAGGTFSAASQKSDAAGREDALGEEAEAMMAVVEVTLMEAQLALHTGDYAGSYDKQSCAVELLSVLAQSAQTSAASASRPPAPTGGTAAAGADVAAVDARLTGARLCLCVECLSITPCFSPVSALRFVFS
jgi:hypothetical protein